MALFSGLAFIGALNRRTGGLAVKLFPSAANTSSMDIKVPSSWA
jgi:hypothetical protein